MKVLLVSLNLGYSLYNFSSISAKVELPLQPIARYKFCSGDIKLTTLSFSNLIFSSLLLF